MKTSGLSGRSAIQRVMDAARTPLWSLGLARQGQIMATRDSGQIGQPWAVLATRSPRGMSVTKFQPSDDVGAEGESIGELSGNPREMGRQLRALLEDFNVEP